MKKDKASDNIGLVRFFQDGRYLERAVQIKNHEGYDNYLDYYVSEKLSPLKYVKMKAKSLLKHKEDPEKQVTELLEQIDPKDYICVIAPIHIGKKMDGYYKRVEQADEEILKGRKKIYLDHTDLGNRDFRINRIDDEHLEISYNSFDDAHIRNIKTIIDTIQKVYIHSVHVLIPDVFNYEMMDVIFNDGNKTVLDLHGAVSEELKQFDTPDRSKMAEFVEETVFGMTDRIICMSEAMKTYYVKKYRLDPKKLSVISIMPFKDGRKNIKKKKHEGINVIYAGGIQKWQNIDLIKESVKKNIDNYSFRIFTHDCGQLKEDWKDIESDNLLIGSRTNEEICKEYESCDFGYLLRDDNIVNNVACPTKMMEYLTYGIIPILKTDRIGNFREYGLSYVSLKDFNKGLIPDDQERKKMIAGNSRILKTIMDQTAKGQKEIDRYLK